MEGRKYGKMNFMEDYMKDVMRGKLYVRWNEGKEDYFEDGMKGTFIWKMEWRVDYMEDGMKGGLYGRWNEGKEDSIEDGISREEYMADWMEGRKIIWKM